ncbi:MAG: DUF697 domain-containing protein, partial [Lutimaribacter sp.]
GLLANELTAGYRAELGAGPAPARPAVQYADFAAWQRAWSETPACAAQIDYWRKQLAGTTALELPASGPRPARPSAAGGTVVSKVSRRFGEGVVNAALTARVGIAALDLCRPLPFAAQKRPGVSALLGRALRGLFGRA